MKVMLEPDTGVVFTGKDKDGNDVQLKSLTITPYFKSDVTADGRVALCKALHKSGAAIDVFTLKANAKTGKILRGKRDTKPKPGGAVPEVDTKDPVKI